MRKKIQFIVLVIILSFTFAGCSNLTSSKIKLLYDTYNENLYTYDLLELAFNIDMDFKNPYDTDEVEVNAEITLPSNEKQVYPMFYYIDYQRMLRNDVEYLTEISQGKWGLRYTPLLGGTYKIKVIVRYKGQITKSENYEYSVKSGNRNGFLKVSDDKTHLVFENNSPFIGIGNNLCGWEWGGEDNLSGTYDYDKWFMELSSSGANMTQFDLCEGDNIEWTNNENELPYSKSYQGVNYYNQEASWKTDYKVKLATDLGLYFRFSLYHWEDFDNENGNFPDWGWSRNPYNLQNGGSVSNVSEFFTSEKAKKQSKDYLRYVLARWGYSPNVMVWELWNEVDSPDMFWGEGKSYNTERNNIVKWHKEMGEYIKSIDSRHLLTTSFANSANSDEMWKLKEMDVTTFHRYSMYNSQTDGGMYNGTYVLYNIINQRLQMYQKPVIAGEFALSPGGDIQKNQDPNGIEFHNQLWASIFSGSFGTAMHWTWGSYIDNNDLYYHYQAVSNFFMGENLNSMKVETNIRSNPEVITFKMQSNNRGFAWIRNSQSDFQNLVVNENSLSDIENYVLSFNNIDNNQYYVEIFDTYSGEVIQEFETTAVNKKLLINIPKFNKDLAVKFYLCHDHYTSIDLGNGGKLCSTFQSGNSIKLLSCGSNVGGMSDDCRFAYISVSGDFVYTVKVNKINYGGEFATAGIMIRNSLSPSSKMLYFCVNSVGQYNYICRTAMISSIDSWKNFYVGGTIKIERINNVISLYVSYDGHDYILVQTISNNFLNNTIYLGIASTSKNTYGYGEALITDICYQKKVNNETK